MHPLLTYTPYSHTPLTQIHPLLRYTPYSHTPLTQIHPLLTYIPYSHTSLTQIHPHTHPPHSTVHIYTPSLNTPQRDNYVCTPCTSKTFVNRFLCFLRTKFATFYVYLPGNTSKSARSHKLNSFLNCLDSCFSS